MNGGKNSDNSILLKEIEQATQTRIPGLKINRMQWLHSGKELEWSKTNGHKRGTLIMSLPTETMQKGVVSWELSYIQPKPGLLEPRLSSASTVLSGVIPRQHAERMHAVVSVQANTKPENIARSAYLAVIVEKLIDHGRSRSARPSNLIKKACASDKNSW